ncbi:MAG: FAD-dependent oxidoreductase, partial [Spiroplasma sp.]|nr:FAD-dependent oxidoreductase [Mycoplasmatales bacterium]
MKKYDAIIIGGGAAGMSATKTLANQNKSVLLIETEAVLGGVLNQCIHSGFGVEYYQEDLTGPTFANRLANELKETSATIELGSHVLSVNEDKEVEYTNETGYYKVCAKAIIFALGSLERSAGAIALPGKRLNGIHTAGSAQQYINMEGNLVGKKIFILGSGDIGLIMARRMHLEGAKILGVAEMMPYSNGLARNIAQCLNDFDIPLYLSHVVSDCRGDDNLSQVEICEIDEQFNLIKGTEKQFDVDTLLLAVGLIPINTLYKMLNLEIDNKTKSIKVDSNYQTSLPGFFSCGNCLHVHDIVDFAAIEGEIAATYCN